MTSPDNRFDYLVVGQGIAGTALTFSLLKAGKKVLVVDAGNANSSSAIAAGIINPVTGKRMVRSWLVDELLSFARGFYRELEAFLGEHVLDEVTICRYLTNPEDKRFCEEQQHQDWFKQYVNPLNYQHSGIHNTIGGVAIKPALRVRTAKLLAAFRGKLAEDASLLEEAFDYAALQLNDKGVSYKGHLADMVLFAEGVGVLKNPWFSWLPQNPSKGEILIARIPGLVPDEDKIPMKGLYFVPLEADVFYVGSTNAWNFEDALPSDAKREEILRKMRTILNCEFEILDHKAAVRPAVKDRRPLIGIHPEHKSLAVFNGMGTKGFSLSPYFAEQFAKYLVGGGEMNEEVDIMRYYIPKKTQTRFSA